MICRPAGDPSCPGPGGRWPSPCCWRSFPRFRACSVPPLRVHAGRELEGIPPWLALPGLIRLFGLVPGLYRRCTLARAHWRHGVLMAAGADRLRAAARSKRSARGPHALRLAINLPRGRAAVCSSWRACPGPDVARSAVGGAGRFRSASSRPGCWRMPQPSLSTWQTESGKGSPICTGQGHHLGLHPLVRALTRIALGGDTGGCGAGGVRELNFTTATLPADNKGHDAGPWLARSWSKALPTARHRARRRAQLHHRGRRRSRR